MNAVAWMIVACEIAFWVVIVAGLSVRYVLKQERLGLFLLALTPVIDLILLVMTSVDLHRGATATFAHAAAAIYIGVSIAFGKSMIAWADERFQYYIAKKGPKPAARYGMAYAKHYFKSWLLHVISFLIGAGLLVGLTYWINDPSRTEALTGAVKLWTIIVAVDFAIALSNFVWPKREKGVRSGDRTQ